MDEIEIILPKLGESIVEATIVEWFKKEGDFVQLDEPLVEVSTDKVNSEIPSPIEGVLKKIIAAPEQTVKVGELLAVVSTKEDLSSKEIAKKEEKISVRSATADLSSFYSPAVLRLASEAKISMQELDSIEKTGEGGRLTKKDLEKHLQGKSEQVTHPQTERIKMNTMRKKTAENMVRSFYEAPHASLINEVDVTELVKKIQKEKESFQKEHGVKLSITAFVAKAITKALQAYPLINASLENDTIIMKRFVNLGIAVSVEHGILVPVIQNCQGLKLLEISKKISMLATKARSNQLSPDEIADGTITLTNFGMTGTKIGIPIIRYPEVAIIGLGAITKQVKALEDHTIGIRSVMHVCLTFDHRVLDGMYGCGFLKELQNHLENPQDS